MKQFNGNFTQQEPMSEATIARAVDVMRSGRLHRYNLKADEIGEVALLETEYAAWQGRNYCLAVTSGGQAMQIALRAVGVKPKDKVLTNAFTLAPVPGAIEAVGGETILVEIDENLRIDLVDLDAKAASSGAKVLLLSHMRGHLCNMDKLMEICKAHKIEVVEDCAHTMGSKWNGVRSGNFGKAACFSTQTYKHINSGEGGLLVSNDAELIARATIFSGSYMLYERHGTAPSPEIFETVKYETPNCSARMDALRAAILRPQLESLDGNVQRWNERYDALAIVLANAPLAVLPNRPKREHMVGSSLQFRVPSFGPIQCQAFVAQALERGVELKWFGSDSPLGFTSNHHSWQYINAQKLDQTDRIMATLFDLRLPLTFSVEDCVLVGEIIVEVLK